MDALEKRRSIRKYKPDIPSDEEIRRVVAAATLAPSACNLQVAEFVYVNAPETMKKLAEIATGKVSWAPACIIGIYDSRFVRERSAHVQSLAAAVENMLIRATELGLGTCWIAGFGGDRKIRKLLSIPRHFAIGCIVLIGYPEEQPPPPYKSPVEQILHFNRYEGGRPRLNLSIDPRRWSPEDLAEYRRRIFSVYNKRLELGFLSDAQFEALWEEIAGALGPSMAPNCTLLELHAWDLRLAKRMAQSWPDKIGRVIIADQVEENLRVAKETCPDFETLKVGMEYEFDLEDESVDLALLVHKLEFEPSPEGLLEKLVPKIKREGRLLIVSMLHGSLYDRMIRLRLALARIPHFYERSPFYKLGPFAFVREEKIMELLSRNGLAAKHVRRFDIGLWREETGRRRGARFCGVLGALLEGIRGRGEECLLVVAEKV